MQDRDHVKRVKQELAEAGVTRYGLLKSESRYLPNVIRPDEHIHAVVYGQFDSNSAMLVATDMRVIYLDCKPMATMLDEITYDVVQGVEFDIHTVFATLMMQTNIGNYTARFANIKCAGKFAEYLENKKLKRIKKTEPGTLASLTPNAEKLREKLPKFSQKIVQPNKVQEEFLIHHHIGTLSTVDRRGTVYGAVVYYIYLNSVLYILTRSETQKAKNIYAHSQVSYTIYDEEHLQTMQILGIAEVEQDKKIKMAVYNYLLKPRIYRGVKQLPPVTKNQFEAYLVLKIIPTTVRLNDFNN